MLTVKQTKTSKYKIDVLFNAEIIYVPIYSLIWSTCDLLDRSLVWIQVWQAMIQQYISDLIHS